MPAPTAMKPPTHHLFSGRNLPWLVDMQARERGDQVYLIWEPFDDTPRSWTYAQFAEETRTVASGLMAAGVTAGDYVLLHLENCPEFLFVWHACARIGAIVVTTNTNSTADELGYFASHCGAAVAITQPKLAGLVAGLNHPFRWIAAIERGPVEEVAPPESSEKIIPFASLRGDPSIAPSGPDDALTPGSIQFTSGTTSRPKGVVWTQANALWAARTQAAILDLNADDCGIALFPLFHTNALAYTMLATLWAGGRAVLTPRFSTSRFWDIATRHKCTWASMTGFPINALMQIEDPPEHDFRKWAFGIGDLGAVRKRWGIRVSGWFGMTETVSACITTEQEFPGTEMAMGRPRPEYQVSIRRPDGTEADVGESGQLFIRGIPGISLFLEYLHAPEATEAAFDKDGWFDTGDEVVARAGGELFYVGRVKDMLKVGGENVAAIEIESVIAQVPGVRECAVVGKPDRMRDEVPVAFIVSASPGPELERAILMVCEQKLSRFKRPQEIRFIDALPTGGPLAKILKKDLREMASSK